MRSLLISTLLVFTAASCSSIEEFTGREPIVDMQGISIAAYQADLMQCRYYADQVELGKQVAVGAATGAVIGGAVGASVGNSDTAKRTAGVGAASGTLSGVRGAVRERQGVIRNCLSGRGYRVLN